MHSNKPFVAWLRDLNYREQQYLLARRPPDWQDVVWRYGLMADDAAFLGEIDRAFTN